jgi:hypothetical protein
MKSITIHNLEDSLALLIQEKAKKNGLSLNKTIKMLLRKSLGLNDKREDNKEEFLDLFGVWTKNDEKQFIKRVEVFNNVEAKDWE